MISRDYGLPILVVNSNPKINTPYKSLNGLKINPKAQPAKATYHGPVPLPVFTPILAPFVYKIIAPSLSVR